MKIELLKQALLWDELAGAPAGSEAALNIAGVYQDRMTRDWGMQYCRRATRMAGEQSVQSAWYSTDSLSDPEYLQDAVRASVVADVIVVSVHAAHELPRDLRAWIDAWLPRRRPRAGALSALITATKPLDIQIRNIEYLQSVARAARLDFISLEHNRPAASLFHSSKPATALASAKAQARADLHGRRFDAFTMGFEQRV